MVDATADAASTVAGDRAICERDNTQVVEATTVVVCRRTGCIAENRAGCKLGSSPCKHNDATTGGAGRVVGDGAADHVQRAGGNIDAAAIIVVVDHGHIAVACDDAGVGDRHHCGCTTNINPGTERLRADNGVGEHR